MRIRIDYLNKEKEAKYDVIDYDGDYEDYIDVWFEIITILEQWATDIRVYNISKELWKV